MPLSVTFPVMLPVIVGLPVLVMLSMLGGIDPYIFGAKGMRVTDPAALDDAIRFMLDTPGAVVMDIAVDELENCFPMIPSGAAHNEMLLGPEDEARKPVSEEGMVLV